MRGADHNEPQISADLGALLRTDWGRRIAMWLVFQLGELMSVAMRSSPLGHAVAAIKDGDTADRHAAFFDGRRDMASDIYAALAAADPAGVLEMHAEYMRAKIAEIASMDHKSAMERQDE